MKRIYALIMMTVMVSFLAVGAEAAVDVNSLFMQLKDQLLKSGLTSTDISATESSAKSMLGLGANQADIKSVLLDLVNQGFKGKDLGSLTSLVNDLMQSGQAIKSAWPVVSQAIQQVKLGGFSGSDLVAKVQEIVNEKKAQLLQLHNAAQSAGSNTTATADNVKKSLGSIFGK